MGIHWQSTSGQCDTSIREGTGRRTVTMMAPLLLTNGPVWYEAVLHRSRTRPVRSRVPTCDSAHSWWLHSAASLGYILATSMVISGWVPTCDSAHSRWLYSAAPLSDSVILSCHWANQSLLYLNNAELLAGKRTSHNYLSHWFDSRKVWFVQYQYNMTEWDIVSWCQ